MPILFLDLATSTGYASGAVGGTPSFGTFTLPKTGDDIGTYLIKFEAWLTSKITAERPSRVFFEVPILPRQTNIFTTRKLQGLAGVTEMVCVRAGVPVQEVGISSIKLFFAGHGKAEKHHMELRARALGWDVEDDNQADACGGWLFCCAIIDPALRAMAAPKIKLADMPAKEPRPRKPARKARRAREQELPF